MKIRYKSYFFLFLISGAIVALDQYTKFLIRSNLLIGEVWVPWDWLAPYVRVVHWYNTGVAFGMFQDANTLFAILAIIVSLGIIFYYPRVEKSDWILRLALSLQLGGAVGNLLDRLFVGHVTDFISVGSFPVFNVADSCISVGVVVLLLGLWVQEKREKKENEHKTIHQIHEDTSC